VSDLPEQPTVLLVDNDRDVRTLIRAILDDLDIDIHEFSDGKAAFDFLSTYGAQLVITNLRLPGLDGNQLLARIRSNRQHSNVPVLVITGDLKSVSLDEAPDGLLNKPFDPADVRESVRNLLSSAYRLRP
jgi:DNA-binding response OmpR family regulator